MLIDKNTIEERYINIYSLHDKKISIPIFQRFYDWKSREIEQLKNEILELAEGKDSELYLLDFIFYEEDDCIKLADGQQRIITINNLIKVIKSIAKEHKIQIEDISLFDISYDVLEYNEKYLIHLNNYPRSPFKEVFLNLKKFVEQNIEKINDIIEILKNRIFVYAKKCKNADDAFIIFQQINTGGKPLTKDEIIKTAINQYASIYNISIADIKFKTIKQEITSYYKFISDNNDANFDNMQIISFIKKNITKDRNTFQSFINIIHTLKQVENNPIKFVIEYINRSTLLDVLNILVMMNVDITINRKYLDKLLLPLCMMSIMLSLNNGSPTTFRYLLNEVIRKIKCNETLENIELYLINEANDNTKPWKRALSDFEDDLGNTEVPIGIKKALLIIDIIDKNKSGFVNVKKINLEHIYPQNPKIDWALNGWPSHSEDQRKIINNIGNLLLICETVNKKIKNAYITDKVKEYEKIINKDKILQTEINSIDFKNFEENKDKYISERQKTIARRIQKSLPFGQVLIKD